MRLTVRIALGFALLVTILIPQHAGAAVLELPTCQSRQYTFNYTTSNGVGWYKIKINVRGCAYASTSSMSIGTVTATWNQGSGFASSVQKGAFRIGTFEWEAWVNASYPSAFLVSAQTLYPRIIYNDGNWSCYDGAGLMHTCLYSITGN